MGIENVGDKQYCVTPDHMRNVAGSHKIVLRTRVMEDRDDYVATAKTEREAQAIAKALNEANGY
jgi:hypothetical protein